MHAGSSDWEGAHEPFNWKKIKMFEYSLNNPLFDGAQEAGELINFLLFSVAFVAAPQQNGGKISSHQVRG